MNSKGSGPSPDEADSLLNESASDLTIMESTPKAKQSNATPGTGTANAIKAPASVARRIQSLTAAFILFVVTTIGLLIFQGRESALATVYISAAGELQMLSQQVAKAAQLGIRGEQKAFAELRTATDRFASLMNALESGGTIDSADVPPSEAALATEIGALREIWARTGKDARQILSEEQILVSLRSAIESINTQAPALLDASENLAALKLREARSESEVAMANTAIVLLQRVAAKANSLNMLPVDPEAMPRLASDVARLEENLNSLRQSSFATGEMPMVDELATATRASLEGISGMFASGEQIALAGQAASRILEDSDALLSNARALSKGYESEARGTSLEIIGAAITGIISLLLLGLIARLFKADLVARQVEAESQRQNAENERNLSQQAILRLMNEMGDLADGDLTVRATVSEDITGAIADTVNYTIEELSVLVRRINDAATRVAKSSESAQQTSNELLDATERQTREIEEAGATIQRMADSISGSSARAMQSAQVARRSLDSTRKGTHAVENTIKGMNEIREQIQETSKRIKRLGESSQEIGEIVELISDITEQTNVLALNAAIQAASAGEAGRGFTVVAEEVQRLAERSGEATKQIAAIVKTIQTDTKDAVAAMEAATHDVVEGAQLSDAAGRALTEIGDVTAETARVIEQLSTDTQAQAATATRVAENMKDILAITEQTTRGTQQTAVSIGQLADLAVELKGSVSGFRV